jgi:hypothetical protein
VDFVNKEYIKTKHMQHCPLDIAKQRPRGSIPLGRFLWVDSGDRGSFDRVRSHDWLMGICLRSERLKPL